MPNLRVQRFIYRNLVQRPKVNQALNYFGKALNKIGLPYATGLTRDKATLFASNNHAEISKARVSLLASRRSRALGAVKNFEQMTFNLFEKVVQKTREIPAPGGTTRAALEKAKQILSPDQISDLFGKIVEKCGSDAAGAFYALPAALEKVKQILSPEQMVDLFGKIVEKCGRDTENAFYALPAALEAKLSPEQIVDLFGRIVEKCEVRAGKAFKALPAALKAKLSPDQIVDLFGKIAEKCKWKAGEAFYALPAALEKAKQILSPDQISDLFGKIAEKCEVRVWEAGEVFKALPAALEKAKQILSPDQISDLFGKIAEKCGRDTDNAFYTLPAALAALEAKLSPEQIVDLFGKIVEKCEWGAWEAFKALPSALAALEAKLSLEQILDVYTTEEDLSPAGNAVLSLYKFLLYDAKELNPDLKIKAIIEQIREEGKKAQAGGLPSIGGKIGGEKEAFGPNLLSLLETLGFEVRSEILGERAEEQTLVIIPPGRSSFEAVYLIDLLKEISLFKNGRTYRHQVAISGPLQEKAKHIALALHSSQPFRPRYPEKLPAIAGFETVAPITEGGGVLEDINGNGSPKRDRFDIPLLTIFQVGDPKTLLQEASKKKPDDRTILENFLLTIYEEVKKRWSELPKEDTLEGIPDKELRTLFRITDKNGDGVWISQIRERPDLTELTLKAMEGLYGENLREIEENHRFTLYASHFLSLALQAKEGTKLAEIYSGFMAGMQKIYREYDIEDVLDTPWIGKKWNHIYPSLAKLEDAEGSLDFCKEIRTLVVETVRKLENIKDNVPVG